MTNQQQTTVLTTPSNHEIVTERVFDAPRDRVWAAYTDPELIPQWWGPRDAAVTVDKMDVQPGGAGGSFTATPRATSSASAGPIGR